MNLSHDQKKYIKKHIKNQTTYQIAQTLNLEHNLVTEFVKKRWSEEKLKTFNTKENSLESTNKQATDNNFYKWFAKTWLHILILIALVFITYTNSLNNAFVSDDIAEIRDNPKVGNLLNAITTRPFGFIRPVIYWAAYHLGELSPFWFRITSIGFHTGSSILIYLIVLKIQSSKKVAFFTALLFAVHPAISEAVVWISGGMYTQYSFFFLLSFLFYILSKKSVKYYILSILNYLLAFMSHPQMPAGLVAIFLFYEYSFGNLKRNWAKSIPFFCILALYFFINLGGLSERTATLQNVHYQEKGVDNPLVLIPVAISNYFQLLIWPKDLTLYHSELYFTPPEFVIRSTVTLIYFAIIIYTFFKNKTIFFWSSFFFIALSPTLTPFRLNWIVAERYIYLPSLGIFVLVGYGISKLISIKKIGATFIVIFSIILVSLTLRTIIRNIDWKSEDNLWMATGKTSPSSPNTHNNLGDVYGRWGDKQKALQEFQAAIMLKPNYADAYHNLANTYRETGAIDKAIENYTKATQFNPNLWQSHQNLAAIYFSQQQIDLALEHIQKAIQINPKNLNLVNNLGILYLTSGNKDKAKQVFSQVLTIDPQNMIAKQGLMETSR